MTNSVSSKKVNSSTSKVMRANRGFDTRPELELRRHVHRLGIRYSVNKRPEPSLNRRADLVFKSAKVAVYLHGCFWHGCSLHYSTPKTNKAFWSNKVERNQNRDRESKKLLSGMGWKVLTFWEHEDAKKSAQRIVREVKIRRKLFAKP
jgi:DNA mismatch endonuclease (patch repair protein)